MAFLELCFAASYQCEPGTDRANHLEDGNRCQDNRRNDGRMFWKALANGEYQPNCQSRLG